MKYLRFIIESNSNKKLDVFTAQVVKAIRTSYCQKSGPIASKAKRTVYAYNYDSSTISNLMKLKTPKGVKVTIDELTKGEPFYLV